MDSQVKKSLGERGRALICWAVVTISGDDAPPGKTGTLGQAVVPGALHTPLVLGTIYAMFLGVRLRGGACQARVWPCELWALLSGLVLRHPAGRPASDVRAHPAAIRLRTD